MSETSKDTYERFPKDSCPVNHQNGKDSAFSTARGALQRMSPRTIITAQKVDYKRHYRFQFGEYAQTHEEHNNSMNPRTIGAIVLRPVGNGQGSFYFMSITTGRVLKRQHATALPMPDKVIDKIHRMARQQKTNPGLVFADWNLNPDDYDDNDDDETYHDDNNIDNEDDEDDETYHDDNNIDDEDEDGMSYDEEEDDNTHEGADLEGAQDAPDEDDNDANVNGGEAPGPPGEEDDATVVPPAIEDNDNNNYDDNNDDEGMQRDEQQPMETGQPDNLDHQDDVGNEDDTLGIPGVDDETIDPKTPGVGESGEETEEEEFMNQPPEVSPQRKGRGGGRSAPYPWS